MLKRLTLLIFLLFLVSGVMAQFNLVGQAAAKISEKEYEEAKLLIDKATSDPTLADQTRTWYIRGYIYKELFKTDKNLSTAHTFRLEAISSYRKALSLDAEKKEYVENIHKTFNYLASTLYNDAAFALDSSDFQTAIRHYNLFKELMREVDSEMNFDDRDIQFYLVLGSAYNKMYEEATVKDRELYEKVVETYTKVLDLDSNNLSGNYNLGIFFYNEAVHIIDTMDYGAPLDELIEKQEICIALFLKALPYMKRAYALNPERRETLIGLSGIYFSLNDVEKSREYERQLEEIDSKQGVEPGMDPNKQ
ncbi:MAG: hypothetical protein ACFB10_06665 [Salibacteraceae bacterium]|mgnify:CR=1 FL=1